MSSNLESLMQNRIHALYIHDDMNRLISVNEPDTNQITPRLAIMRSKNHLLWRVKNDVPDDTVDMLDNLLQTEPPTANFKQPLKYQADYIGVLEQNAPISKINSGPAYILPELSPTENTVHITRDTITLVEKHFPHWFVRLDFHSPVIAMIEGEIAVAVCFSARKTHTVAEAGVFTIEEYRKKGYAYNVVRDWSVAVRKLGIQPIYSTFYNNLASQSVANKLGAIQFATDFSFT